MKAFHQTKKKKRHFVAGKTRVATIKDEHFVLPYNRMAGGKSLLQILQK